jgi:2-haloacid dehalogenase
MRVLVFDAYGTLFDVTSVTAACRAVSDEPEAFAALWRAKQLEYAFLRSLYGRYKDFWRITQDALRYACKRYNREISSEREQQLLEAWLHLQPFPEVKDTLRQLTALPRLILSNGTPAMLSTLLDNTGLKAEFDAILSVDAVRIYKPAPQVYELAVRHLNGAPREIVFLSANGFDVAGAKTFGFRVCWVNRSGAVLDELDAKPDAIVRTLADLPTILPALSLSQGTD